MLPSMGESSLLTMLAISSAGHMASVERETRAGSNENELGVFPMKTSYSSVEATIDGSKLIVASAQGSFSVKLN